ncbi:MAG: ChaN family lipoprotein [Cyclobacteriaceae bacterium]|nr:ChaN family lipoprotein [Cyclobacteriaceae bacterium]
MKSIKSALLLSAIFVFSVSYAQDKPAYILYNKEGKEVKYSKLEKALDGKNVILFGEHHDSPISHWLELQLTKSLFAVDSNMVLGAEMFEADDQVILNEYLDDKIDDKLLDSEAKLWKNYETDYEPLVLFAKEHHLPFVATNIPRRYARMVSKRGLETLDSIAPKAKEWIAPLPIEVDLNLPGYKNMIETMGSHMPGNVENMARAQASKDATMAYFILKNLGEGPFIHFNGAYHSNNYDGINYYLLKGKPDIHILTISTVKQDNINSLEEENVGIADFIICYPSDMTTTY